MRGFLVTCLLGVLVAAFPSAPPADAGAEPLQGQQWGLARVEAPAAWSTTTGSGAVVAVVDTGVDHDHPELQGRLLTGASWVGCGRRAKPPCGNTDDENGHGTHVAGIAAAPLDGVGVAGVAPGARILPVRVLDADGSGSAADVAAGVRWATDHGADVINLSLAGLPVLANVAGLTGLDGGFADSLEYAAARGALVVAAAGNEALPICDNEFFRAGPGLCVGATDPDDVKAWYSNSGIGVNVVAPGGAGGVFCADDVLSTWPVDQPSFCSDTGYEALAGTSMAVPHASGVGALLSTLGVSGDAAARRILATADDLGAPGPDPAYGAGRVNARRAVGGA